MRKIIKKMKSVLFDNIVVTLDSHFEYDIAHAIFWKAKDGSHPKPFTVITSKDLIEGKWFPVDESKLPHCIKYLDQLNATENIRLLYGLHTVLLTHGGIKFFRIT